MDEFTCQYILWRYLSNRSYKWVTPNVYVFAGWESDLVAVSKSGYIVEYEIKCTRSDFMADRRKKRHRTLSEHAASASSGRTPSVPARFLYACPPGVATAKDLPDYAGLVVLTPPGGHDVRKRAPRLTSATVRASQRKKLATSLMYELWERRRPS